MAKAKLVWKNLDDLPNLRRALFEVHVNVCTAGIPRHLGITLLPGRGIANPSSSMPRCPQLWVEAQDGGAILAIGRRHLPSASEDVAVREVVMALNAVDQSTECRECNEDGGNDQPLLCARPSVCEREHLTRTRSATAGERERCFHFIVHNSSLSLYPYRPAVGCIVLLGCGFGIPDIYCTPPFPIGFSTPDGNSTAVHCHRRAVWSIHRYSILTEHVS